jgi:hypothetical protein
MMFSFSDATRRGGIIPSRPIRSNGMDKFGTSLFYDRQMTAR